MRIMRSIAFGCIAMLAAAFCMSAPAVAVEYSPSVYTLSLSDFDYDMPAVFKVEAIALGINTLPDRSTNAHAVEYICQNQPHSTFRQSVDAYQHIDPHIRTA